MLSAAQAHGARARELHDAALAGGIGGSEAGAEDRHHRADIDDLAAAGRLHRGIDRLRAQEGAGQVGLDHAVPLGEFERVRRLADIDAGIVDEDVDPAELVGDAADHGGDRLLVGDVGRDRNRLGAAFLSSATAAADLASLRPTTAIAAPASASPRAMPSPMPPLPPVTIATLPVRSKSCAVHICLPSLKCQLIGIWRWRSRVSGVSKDEWHQRGLVVRDGAERLLTMRV